MTDSVHVLAYYPELSSGACGYMRMGLYQPLLAAHGVEVRPWTDFNDFTFRVPPEYRDRPQDAIRDGRAQLDPAPIEWADVILFRRWYATVPQCAECDTVAGTEAEIAAHCRAADHRPHVPDILVRALFDTLASRPELLRGRAIMYETDDDLLATQPWTGWHRKVSAERDLVEKMLRRADLVTVTTPVLAARAGVYNSEVRVIRNAVDPRLYADPPSDPAPPDGLRILYYGVASRLRDYAVCRDAIDEVKRRLPGTRRVWIGAAHKPEIVAAVDEALPYVDSVPGFVRTLVNTRADIGVAPVVGDAFDRAHSDFHWVDYSLAGAATVASRTMGGGPYDVIRDGVDGLLARNRGQWREALGRLAASPGLRQDLAGRAKERVLAEYDARDRVREWADAFRWAAEHGGRGALPRLHAVAAPPSPAAIRVAAEAADNLAHRQRARRDAAEAISELAARRGSSDVCWPPGADRDPLVTVIIPTYNRGRIVADRSLASVVNQTYTNLEILVVGDGATPETVEAVRSVPDPRIRFVPLPERGPRPDDPERAWQMSGSRPYNHGLTLARGQWIAPQADDDEFTPDHVETLLGAAIEHRVEMIYGAAWMETPQGPWFRIGEWPPHHAGFAAGAVLYSAGLRFLEYDEECWRENEPNDWNLWRRMLDAGVRMGFVDEIVFRHYAEARHRQLAS